MAAAFAEQERDRRGVGDRIEIVTGGTQPADHVHDIVVEAMAPKWTSTSATGRPER